MSTVTTSFSPLPDVTVTVSVIAEDDSITTRVFTSTSNGTFTDEVSYSTIEHPNEEAHCKESHFDELYSEDSFELRSEDSFDMSC